MNKDNQLISVCMATYNGEKFIKEQLNSILSQTYKNIEIIITDDCSKDKTIEIIKEYQLKDKRIQLYQNKTNLGFTKNFERAISLSKGEYIALADQDDIWKLDKLEILKNNILNNILIYSDAEIIDKQGKKLESTFIAPYKNLVQGKNPLAFLFTNCISGNTMLFKRTLLSNIFPIPKEIKFHDHWIAFVATQVGTISYTKEPLIYYRRYDEQVTNSATKNYSTFIDKFKEKEKRLKRRIELSLKEYEMYLRLPFIQDECKNLLTLLVQHYTNFNQGYFNIPLYKYLNSHKDMIFAIQKKKKRKRYARNLAFKLKLHKLLLFSA